MSDWKNSLILEKDETIAGSWEGSYEWSESWVSGSFGFKLFDQVKTESGIFALTNRKIIFLKKEGSLLGKKAYHPVFTIPVEKVSSVSFVGARHKSVLFSLTDDQEARFYLSGIDDESSLNQFRELMRKQVSARKEQLGKAREDSSKKGIIKEKEVIIKVRCRYCGNTYEETLDKCPHCGGRA